MVRKRVLLGAVLAAGVLVPSAASASRPPALKLALVPLPKSVLGSAVASFSLSQDSGPVSTRTLRPKRTGSTRPASVAS